MVGVPQGRANPAAPFGEIMKKAFTLIEIHVVIAIIAILAAILFPVFAQAKVAAKKAASISNQKQLGLAIIQYAADNDDIYPRNDDCIKGSSLNSKFHAASYNSGGITQGCTNPPDVWNRVNHYAWQKWVLPYTKSVELFFHPATGKLSSQWTDNGQIMGSYAINLALTGALNTFNRDPNTASNAYRDSFIGGNQSALGDVAAAMIMMELYDDTVNFAPVFLDSAGATNRKTAYPFAVREAWETRFYKIDGSCNNNKVIDNSKVPFGNQINLSYADGHTKSVNIGKFLSDTPTAVEYGITSRPACGLGSGSWTTTKPVWTQPWPMWALQ